jgi:hypothetical protein
MKRKSVAAVLSAVVFPGCGQMYLGQKKRGLLFLAPVVVAVVVVLRFAAQQASAMADDLAAGRLGLDPIAISARLHAQPIPASVNVAAAVFIACWVASVIDALVARQA